MIRHTQSSAHPPVNLTTKTQQSPICIEDAIYADLGDRALDIDWADLGSIQGKVKSGDHGVTLEISQGHPSIKLDRQQFEMKSFHFHAPSEHVIEGKRYPMEMHIVHQNPENGQLAVVGIMVEAEDDRGLCSVPFTEFLHNVKDAVPTSGTVDFDPSILLPKTPQKYYRYEGSLTTPDFAENVSWSVLKEPLKVSREELTELHEIFEKDARETQPLHRRFVLKTFQD